MALFWNMYVCYDNEFVIQLARVCKDYSVLWLEDRQGIDNRIRSNVQEIADSNLFSETLVYEYPWEIVDTYDDFINFLCTGNGYISLTPELRLAINSQICDIFNRAGGIITRKFNCVLYISQKLN